MNSFFCSLHLALYVSLLDTFSVNDNCSVVNVLQKLIFYDRLKKSVISVIL